MRCGRKALTVCVVHVHNAVKWDSDCCALRIMYKTCLGLRADIVCGDGNQAWYFKYKEHNQQSTDSNNETHPEPLNGLLTHSCSVRGFPPKQRTTRVPSSCHGKH